MYIARKITDYSKFSNWCMSGSRKDRIDLDDFSQVIDLDENVRTLKRRVFTNWHGYFDKVLIFHETVLVSWRDMAFGKRWSKWFEMK